MKKKINIPKAFLLFLLAAFLFWFLIKLSKEYTTVVSYTIDYINVPQSQVFEQTPLNELNLVVKASGFKLFKQAFKQRILKLSVADVKKVTENEYVLETENQQNEIQNQLSEELQLQQITPHSIPLKLATLTSKKVVVKPNVTINYQLGYNLLKPLEVMPDSIVVFGTDSQLKDINFINLKELVLNNVSSNFEKELAILPTEILKKVKLNTKKVILKGEVDKFTEGTFELPFTVKNVPSGSKITTFPKQVKVIYKVGLKNFDSIKKSSFSVVCDYNEAEKIDVNYLIPKVIEKSELLTSVNVEPNKIEFLIEK